jgi:hypothetical protein
MLAKLTFAAILLVLPFHVSPPSFGLIHTRDNIHTHILDKRLLCKCKKLLLFRLSDSNRFVTNSAPLTFMFTINENKMDLRTELFLMSS